MALRTKAKPKQSATDTLAGLLEREADLKRQASARGREVEQAKEAERQTTTARRTAKAQAMVDGGTHDDKRAEREAAEARAAVVAAEEAFAVAHEASAMATAKVVSFKEANADDLLKELEPEAEAAVRGLADAIQAVIDRVGDWHNVERRVIATLSGTSGFDPRDVPSFNSQPLVRELRQTTIPVPIPTPAVAQAPEIPEGVEGQTFGGVGVYPLADSDW